MKFIRLFCCIALFFNTISYSQSSLYPFQDSSLEINLRVADLISRLTLEEKAGMLQHSSPAVERLGILPYSWWNEALHGVGRAGTATVFPQSIALAATFDEDAMLETFTLISDEARAKYNEAQRNKEYGDYHGLTFWTPNINLFRDPRWGRGMETFGEDPYLTMCMGMAVVNGLQGNHPYYRKADACAKHFVAHSGPESSRHQFNAIVSSRDLWQSYLPAFEFLVKNAKVGEVMCAYNRLNGEPCCANNYFLSEIVRNKWHFNGLVVTDCWAVNDFWETDTVIPRHKTHYSEVLAIADAFKSGVDLECGNSCAAILEAVKLGYLTEEDLNMKLSRVLSTRFRLGMFDSPEIVPWSDIPISILDCPKHQNQALLMAQKSIVLLKNENQILPLDKNIKKIAVIGPNANDSTMLWGNYNGFPRHTVTILQGLKNKLPECDFYFEQGCNLTSPTSPENIETILSKAKESDVIIFVGGLSPSLEGEELPLSIEGFDHGDRTDIELPAAQRNLLRALKKTGKPVILVLCTGSAIALTWENKNLDAIVNAWYGGEEAGTAVADVLFGDYNPAGRLPVTFYKSSNQLPPFDDYSMQNRTYRFFKKKPLYPFGYGLSFTSFSYDNPKISLHINIENSNQIDSICAELEVTNTGTIDGEEVVQFYIKNYQDKEGPLKSLAAFSRIFLKAGERKKIKVSINPTAFYSFDDASDSFIFIPGKYELLYGSSSNNKYLKRVKIFIGNTLEIKL